MPLPDETVAIPVTKGLDLRTSARLVEPPALLEAKNARFSGDGSSKRYGHVEHKAISGAYNPGITRTVLDEPVLTPYGAKVLDASWLFGWGRMIDGQDNPSDSRGVSDFPEAGYLFGGGVRDTQVFGWNGHSLFNYAPSGAAPIQTNAVMPALRSKVAAKSQTEHSLVDACDNGKLRTVVWADPDSGDVLRTVTDSVTGAVILHDDAIAFVDPENVRCFILGEYTHILVYENNTTSLQLRTFNNTNLTLVSRSLGTSDGPFDVWKVDETLAIVVHAEADAIEAYWLAASGSDHPDFTSPRTLVAAGDPITAVAICAHPVTFKLGLVYNRFNAADTMFGEVFTPAGDTLLGATTIAVSQAGEEEQYHVVSVAPKYLLKDDEFECFDAYVSFSAPPFLGGTEYRPRRILRVRFDEDAGVVSTVQKWNLQVASQGIRAGDRTFVWACKRSIEGQRLQSTWFLLDESLDPVGKLNFGTASAPAQPPRSVNWRDLGTPAKDRLTHHMALTFQTRVPTTDDQNGLFAEPTPQFVEIDWLPKLQSAQAGRCTYFAGAQLWCYDGAELTEANFHLCPEITLIDGV